MSSFSGFAVPFIQFLIGLTVLTFSYQSGTETLFTKPKTVWDLLNLSSFYIYAAVIVASCVFFRGANNHRTAIVFALAAFLDLLVWYWLWYRSGLSGVYLVVWFGFISRLVLFTIVKYSDIISEYSFTIIGQIPQFRAFSNKQLEQMMPTKYEIRVVDIVKLYVLLEFAYAIVNIAYALLMGIPKDGSIYDNIIQKGHFDFYYLYLIGLNMVLFYFVYLVVQTVIEEQENGPDYL